MEELIGAASDSAVRETSDHAQSGPEGWVAEQPQPNDLTNKTLSLGERTHSTFRLDDTDLSRWPLQIDATPAADDFGRIVRLAGE
ncbi:hypothetical protein, partial [Streptobacillus moniliformis]|uniref:hypothetical protein n=1 Tax=Streptobacillus moniliformis TaxID=34105 RepID=UPI001E5B4B7C